MKGTIIGYDTSGHTGIISGFDGNRYRFALEEWKSAAQPNPNMEVDFEPDGGIAREIFMLATTQITAPPSSAASGFWGQFWGWVLGIFFLLAGIGMFLERSAPGDIFAGILFIGVTVFLIPPIFAMISAKSGHAITTGPRVLIVIAVLVVAFISLTPEG